jgi:hypothetical protein
MTSNEIPTPKVPLKIALIGTGNRSQTIYHPLFGSLRPWMEVVAVCDPVAEHCDTMAEQLGVRGYYDIHQLVKDKPMEAALIVTPVPSHHSTSVYLSSHGIHNLCETSWCSMVSQAREMIETARGSNVIVRVAENFLRFPIDRFSQVLRDSGYLGRIGRIFSYADHTGYHNNSRWVAFAQSHPLWVQSIEHTMGTAPFHSQPQRYHDKETFRGRYFLFPSNLLVIDSAANVKGFLGRHPRPGYTEWQGERGTLVHRAHVTAFTGSTPVFSDDGKIIDRDPPSKRWDDYETELHCCSAEKIHHEGDAPGWGGGIADEISPVRLEFDQQARWVSMYCRTGAGLLQYVNPHRPERLDQHRNPGYYSAVMDHVIDFALAVRGLRESEFDEEDAMMSLMMEMGAKESALNEGKRIRLPIEGELEAEALVRQAQQKQFGVDPMDVAGMLAISHSKP